MTKEYVCECGRICYSPSSIGGHQRNCKVHLSKIGKLEEMQLANRIIAINSGNTQKARALKLRSDALTQWISEKHVCEKCGKIMTEKFGSGRFCSRKCSNSRIKSEESRIKVSETLRGRTLTDEEVQQLLHPPKSSPRIKYKGPDLPEIVDEHLKAGYFSRNRMSYAEKFWKQVLDNNKVTYIHDHVVQKPKGQPGVFRLDFLVDNIDIEIDGEQHYDKRAIREKDLRRDAYLKEQGFTVYRIRWVNPVNDKNKIIVNKQIEELFKFIGKPRIC